MLERIKSGFTESIQTQLAAAEALPTAIAHAANVLATALLDDKKNLMLRQRHLRREHAVLCRLHAESL